jgi:galactoside O-acetyltransferase
MIRRKYWNIILNTPGDLRVNGPIFVIKPENVSIGRGSTLNYGVILNAGGKITIGNDVHISAYVIINTKGLAFGMDNREHYKKDVVIEDGVWIATGAIINPGVRIGHHAVIGAGAVVTKDVPPKVVVVGVPAKVIKSIE